MIDEDFNVLLIEANINPCLGVTSSFSSRFIPVLVENTLKIAVDPIFQPPPDFASKKSSGEVLPEIKYELIFDQRTDGEELDNLYKNADPSIILPNLFNIKGLLEELNKEAEKQENIIEEEHPDDDEIIED